MHYDEHSIVTAKPKGGDTFQGKYDHWTFVSHGGIGHGGRWVKTATLALAPLFAPPQPPRGYESIQFGGTAYSPVAKAETSDKLPPMACSEGCGFTNEYVGKEHLINGIYVCRQCRPRYERRQRTLALKAQNEAAKSDAFAYGPSWKDGVGGL